jgi:transposase InsO family protein
MKTFYGTSKRQSKDASMKQTGLGMYPPPIYFNRKKVKGGDTSDEDNYKTVTLLVDPDDPEKSETVEKKVRIFGGSENPEDWVKWRIEFDEVVRDMPLTTAIAKTKMALTLLKGRAKELFQSANLTRMSENAEKKSSVRQSSEEVFALIMDDVGRNYFPVEHAYRRQVSYMRHYLVLGNNTVREFAARLRELNNYLPYFPREKATNTAPLKLKDAELVEILNEAKPHEWHVAMLGANIELYDMDWQEAVEYFERLEVRQNIEKHHANKADNGSKDTHKHRKDATDRKKKKRAESDKNSESCKVCKRKGHVAADCWFNSDNKNKPKKHKAHKNSETKYSQEQVMALIQALPGLQNNKKSKKKRKLESSDSEEEKSHFLTRKKGKTTTVRINDTSDEDSEYSCSNYAKNTCFATTMAKRAKVDHKTTEIVGEIRNKKGQLVPLRILLDTGSTATILLKHFVQPGTPKVYKGQNTKWKTMGGNFVTRQQRQIQFRLTEFNTSKIVTWPCHIDETTPRKNAQYDMIIGTDLMTELGIDINFSTNKMSWEGVDIPMRPKNQITDRTVATALYHMVMEAPILKQAEQRQQRILDADYAATDVAEYTKNLEHLNTEQKDKLYRLLNEYPGLFKGGLGTLNVPPIHLDIRPLEEHEKPYHARAFPIPKCYEATTRKEIARLTDIGVFKKAHDSEWAAPTFIQPKKTGDVRILTDFRQLNKYLRRKPFPLPKISDLLQKLEGFSYATAIDLSMGYYHVKLDEESSRLCTTVLPWGKYQYLRLPMGIKNSPDIFQNIINDVMAGLENVRAYLDDILITTSGTFEDHLEEVQKVLDRLEKTGFAVNVKKSSFAVSEIDYLGYWITREGIQPQTKKVEAILRLQPPRTKRELRRFLGMVNYYRDMWRRRSHLLAPLTALVGKDTKFQWTSEHQQAFEKVKTVISRETLLAYPDFNSDFHIFTDASDFQLGSVIMQNNRPLAFYSRKLNPAQRRYTTGEQELLSIVETLKEFRNILLGQKLIVHTDHKNLLYQKMATDRVIRWRLLIEEYGATFEHVSGTKNIVADALSRLDADFDKVMEPHLTKSEMAHLFLIQGETKETDFPLSPELIAKYQRKDKTLKNKIQKGLSNNYSTTKVEGVEVITYHDKIYIPKQLQPRVVAWYHEYLVHPGQSRTEATIRQHFTWPKLREHVNDFCRTCQQCQIYKRQRKKYGHLPATRAEVTPWRRVNVDLIGPYSVTTPNGTHTLRALTMIDPATNWFEVTPLANKEAATVMEAFNNEWLSRYPRPQYIGFDNGSEFKAQFQETCDNYGIKPKPTTCYNPQSNGIIERVHQVLGNALRTFELENRELDAYDPWRPFLSAVAWAIRSTYHTTLQATPGQLVFGRDMLLPLSFKVDWARLQERKQDLIIQNNTRENHTRKSHTYTIGDQVLLDKPGHVPKLSAPRTGPHTITAIYTNGTVRVQRGVVNERINIRRLTPYHARAQSN